MLGCWEVLHERGRAKMEFHKLHELKSMMVSREGLLATGGISTFDIKLLESKSIFRESRTPSINTMWE